MAGLLQPIHGTIAVCEPQPFWTPALQREFLGSNYRVHGCRSPRELTELIQRPRAVVVCDLTAQPSECLNWVATAAARNVPIAVCGSPQVSELEVVCRELGVRSFSPDLVSPAELAQLCRRWLKAV